MGGSSLLKQVTLRISSAVSCWISCDCIYDDTHSRSTRSVGHSSLEHQQISPGDHETAFVKPEVLHSGGEEEAGRYVVKAIPASTMNQFMCRMMSIRTCTYCHIAVALHRACFLANTVWVFLFEWLSN